MPRDEAPPFTRGETFLNGGAVDTTFSGSPGANLEGKEYLFEVNEPDDPTMADPSGRQVRVKVARNSSGVALKGGRVAHYTNATTAPYGCRVDGYCTSVTDQPAGVIDEFLPAAGVPDGDLFYLIVGGPTQVVQGATTAATIIPGDRIVPAAYGATAGDPLGGRFAKQDLTGATAPLGNNIQNAFAVAASTNSTAAATVNCVVRMPRW